MHLRLASISDAEILWKWRNDPATRIASHQTSEIPFESHLTWLRSTLENTSMRLMVAEVDSVAVGTVRVDSESNGDIELSWTVAPEHRGRRLASQMLSMALEIVGRPVRAEIKADNLASIRLAKQVGMSLASEIDGVFHFRLET